LEREEKKLFLKKRRGAKTGGGTGKILKKLSVVAAQTTCQKNGGEGLKGRLFRGETNVERMVMPKHTGGVIIALGWWHFSGGPGVTLKGAGGGEKEDNIRKTAKKKQKGLREKGEKCSRPVFLLRYANQVGEAG